MNVKVEIPDYDGNGLDVIWEPGSKFIVDVFQNEIMISANREGLLSFAKQLLYMAYNSLPDYSHIHYDTCFEGADSSYSLVFQKHTP